MAVFARNMIPVNTARNAATPLWQQHLVDDVDYAVLLEDVDLRDGRHAALGVGQHDLAALGAGGQRVAGNGLDGMLAAILIDHAHQRRGIHLGRHDVVGQDLGELGLVLRLEQGLDGSRRQGSNAALVGANTVNGPAPLSVSTRPAALTAATSVV